MASRKNFRSALFAGLLGLVLVVSGCSSNTDPDTWEQAEEEGDKIRVNFLTSCEEANGEAGGTGDTSAYCECAYDVVRAFYADDFQGFKDAESELRSDPTSIDNSAVIPTALRGSIDACATEHLT